MGSDGYPSSTYHVLNIF